MSQDFSVDAARRLTRLARDRAEGNASTRSLINDLANVLDSACDELSRHRNQATTVSTKSNTEESK